MTTVHNNTQGPSPTPRIESTDEAWDTGLLGRDERYVAVANEPDLEARVDASLGIARKQ